MQHSLSRKQIKEIIKNDNTLTQAGLSRTFDVSRSLVSRWLSDTVTIPDKYHVYISEYICVDINSSIVLAEDLNVEKIEKYEIIKQDLLNQLDKQNKFGRHFEGVVDHAVYLCSLKDDLQEDIKVNGIRVKMLTGNWYEKEVDNAFIRNLNQVSSQLLRVLKDIGINELDVDTGDYDESEFT